MGRAQRGSERGYRRIPWRERWPERSEGQRGGSQRPPKHQQRGQSTETARGTRQNRAATSGHRPPLCFVASLLASLPRRGETEELEYRNVRRQSQPQTEVPDPTCCSCDHLRCCLSPVSGTHLACDEMRRDENAKTTLCIRGVTGGSFNSDPECTVAPPENSYRRRW